MWIEHRPSKPGVAGSNPARRVIQINRTRFLMVSVAQLVEHRIVAPAVVGSIPIAHPKCAYHGEVLAISPINWTSFGQG